MACTPRCRPWRQAGRLRQGLSGRRCCRRRDRSWRDRRSADPQSEAGGLQRALRGVSGLPGPRALINEIGVAKSMRCQGVGRMLIHAAAEEVRSRGGQRIALMVDWSTKAGWQGRFLPCVRLVVTQERQRRRSAWRRSQRDPRLDRYRRLSMLPSTGAVANSSPGWTHSWTLRPGVRGCLFGGYRRTEAWQLKRR
jgi:GNAT superfamily N-acetyltransferase